MVNPILTIKFASNLAVNTNVDVFSEVPNHVFISTDKVISYFIKLFLFFKKNSKKHKKT